MDCGHSVWTDLFTSFWAIVGIMWTYHWFNVRQQQGQ